MRELFSYLKEKSHVIWDWNGTLLDDVEISIEAVGAVLASQGLPSLTRAVYLERFRFPIAQYYAELGIRADAAAYAELSRLFISSYNSRLSRARLFDGVRELLDELKAAGIGCSVLSAAHEPDLKHLLAAYGIAEHFTHIYGLGDQLAHGKIERGRQLMGVLGLPLERVVLVGDTDHDLAVGLDLGVDVVLVTSGHQHESRLRARHHQVHVRL